MAYIFLAAAIVSEVVGTMAVKASEGFTRPLYDFIGIIGYVIALYLLSLVLKTIPVGIAYAIWSGVGIIFVAAAGYFLYKQSLDLASLIGIGLIIAGIIVLNTFSHITV